MKWLLAGMVLVGFALRLGAAERQKVIFDCDLAGDVDDAFAAALLLASPEIEVLGFVMDHGNTPKRAQVACRLLYETGCENIPVVVGAPTPGIVGVDTGIAGDSHQFVWGESFDRVRPIRQDAAAFIVAQLRKYPGEVVLLTVGPVCNLPEVIKRDPGALPLAKRIVSMFGSFRMGYDGGPVPSAEWNVRADIKAAQAFTSCGVPITYVGLDVTTFVKLDEANRTRLLFRQSPLTNALCGLYSLWRYESYAQPDANLFDAVAVGVVLWPELFTSERAHVRVTDAGFTVIDDHGEPNAEVVLTIDQEEFIRRIMSRYVHQNLGRKDRP